MTTCEHCGAEVREGVMRGTGRVVHLDPEPLALGNLEYVDDLNPWVQFIPPERRKDPKDPAFVPPSRRYRSHLVSCPANGRTTNDDDRAFIADVDQRLADR